jgi:hypothetical protein
MFSGRKIVHNILFNLLMPLEPLWLLSVELADLVVSVFVGQHWKIKQSILNKFS